MEVIYKGSVLFTSVMVEGNRLWRQIQIMIKKKESWKGK